MRGYLKSQLKLTDLRELMYNLGVSFKRMRNTMFLSELAYCSPILKQLGKEKARAASAPMVDNIKELFLKLVSSEASTKKRKKFPKGP